MNTKNVKLFDANDKLVDNFDEVIESILIDVHGPYYYDTDEELINTNIISTNLYEEEEDIELEKTKELFESLPDKEAKKISIVDKNESKIKFKDFLPVIFFILIFIIIFIAGYFFLNKFDLTGLFK